MDLVDKQHGPFGLFQVRKNPFEALLEITPVFRACKQCAHIECINGAADKRLRHFAFNDLSGKTLGNGRLADTGLTHIERIVLAPAAQNLHGPRDLKVAADQRIDLSGNRQFIKVYREGGQGIVKVLVRQLFVGFIRRWQFPRFFIPADAVRHVVHDIETGHTLLTQEVDGVRILFRENRDQHVGARNLALT